MRGGMRSESYHRHAYSSNCTMVCVLFVCACYREVQEQIMLSRSCDELRLVRRGRVRGMVIGCG